MGAPYDRITTTIEREWLAEIVAGTKKTEYRQIKPYWTKRFEKVSVPEDRCRQAHLLRTEYGPK